MPWIRHPASAFVAVAPRRAGLSLKDTTETRRSSITTPRDLRRCRSRSLLSTPLRNPRHHHCTRRISHSCPWSFAKHDSLTRVLTRVPDPRTPEGNGRRPRWWRCLSASRRSVRIPPAPQHERGRSPAPATILLAFPPHVLLGDIWGSTTPGAAGRRDRRDGRTSGDAGRGARPGERHGHGGPGGGVARVTGRPSSGTAGYRALLMGAPGRGHYRAQHAKGREQREERARV